MIKKFKELVAEAQTPEGHERVEHTSRKAFEKQAKAHGYHISSVGKRGYHRLYAMESHPGSLMVTQRGEFKPEREGLKIKDSGHGHLHIKKKD